MKGPHAGGFSLVTRRRFVINRHGTRTRGEGALATYTGNAHPRALIVPNPGRAFPVPGVHGTGLTFASAGPAGPAATATLTVIVGDIALFLNDFSNFLVPFTAPGHGESTQETLDRLALQRNGVARGDMGGRGILPGEPVGPYARVDAILDARRWSAAADARALTLLVGVAGVVVMVPMWNRDP